MTAPTRAKLADGRDLLFFALPGHRPAPVADRRPLPERDPNESQLRFDRSTGQWVIIAALRQDRTYKPPADQCPLCPGPTGLTSEVPAPDYDVVVFENRFPSLSGAGRAAAPRPPATALCPRPGMAAREVICFSSDHTGSFAELEPAHARLVVEAWRHRTADLMAAPGIEQVFCFENRGEEIGVTLTHPHGQIYGYPYLTPRTAAMLEQAHATSNASRRQPLCRPVGARGRRWQSRRRAHRAVHGVRAVRGALAGRGAHLPEQVRAQPRRTRRGRTGRVRAGLPRRARGGSTGCTPAPLPYISALHQFADTDAQADGYFHVELMSIRRSATKLKYLAASESAMGAFISDVTPESVAQRLRELGR